MSSSPHNLHTQLVSLIDNSKRSFVAKGKLLYNLKIEGNFKEAVGAGIDTWLDYISQPEIGLSSGEVGRLIQIYQEFVLKLKIDEEFLAGVPVKNIHYLLPLAKKSNDKEEIMELLYAAKELSQRDFRLRVGEIKYDKLTYEYLVMKRCVETGSLTKVHDIPSNDIKTTYGIQD